MNIPQKDSLLQSNRSMVHRKLLLHQLDMQKVRNVHREARNGVLIEGIFQRGTELPKNCYRRSTCYDRTPNTCYDRTPNTCYDRTPNTCYDRTPNTCYDRTPNTCYDRTPNTGRHFKSTNTIFGCHQIYKVREDTRTGWFTS